MYKTFVILFLLLFSTTVSFAADSAVSALTEVTAPNSADVMPVVSGGTTKKLQIANLPIYTGYSGGQTIKGGTGSGENLTLQSTTHATRGKIYLDGAYVSTSQAVSGADTGDGSARAVTITPTSSYIRLTCSDTAGGCAATLSETGAVTGQMLEIECLTANVTTFADSAGVQEVAGGVTFNCDTNDIIAFRYNGSAWLQRYSSIN